MAILGVGEWDLPSAPSENKILYNAWQSMFKRCYSDKYQASRPTYKGCSVDTRWHKASAFKEWFDRNYRAGYQLDKDILVEGNKVYSPETCCYVPALVNSCLKSSQLDGGSLPAGVKRNRKRFSSALAGRNLGTFDTAREASEVYNRNKCIRIQSIADLSYNEGQISIKVHEALYHIGEGILRR